MNSSYRIFYLISLAALLLAAMGYTAFSSFSKAEMYEAEYAATVEAVIAGFDSDSAEVIQFSREVVKAMGNDAVPFLNDFLLSGDSVKRERAHIALTIIEDEVTLAEIDDMSEDFEQSMERLNSVTSELGSLSDDVEEHIVYPLEEILEGSAD